MKRLIPILFVFVLPLSVYAQKKDITNPLKGRPDLKGDLFLDFGFNMLNNRPAEMNSRFFPSKTVNVYFQRPINLGEKSGFTLNPGIGFGLDKLAFKDDMMLVNDPDKGTNSSQLVNVEDVYGEGIRLAHRCLWLLMQHLPLHLQLEQLPPDHHTQCRKVSSLHLHHSGMDVLASPCC